MTISATVICDSVREGRPDLRIASVKVHFPRYILAEVNTHRVFSRSFSSSRAIPVRRMIDKIRADPAMPMHWGINRPGMQAVEEAVGWRLAAVRGLWLTGMWIMTTLALLAARVGIHKQVVNRMIEPWAHVTGIITSTEWANFFALRLHKDADPTFRALAEAIYFAFVGSRPSVLAEGDWHLPFVDQFDLYDADREHQGWSEAERKKRNLSRLMTVSTARCARASYDAFDGKRSTFDQDAALCEKLASSEPKHASPFEHQATPADTDGFVHNLRGWRSQRSFFACDALPGWPPELISE